MQWEGERYARLFVRDTADWLSMPWQSRALFPLLLRKADRAGQIALGRSGFAGLAVLVGLPIEVVKPGLAGLLVDTCVVQTDRLLTIRNFIEAQEAVASNRVRQQTFRDTAKSKALKSQKVTVTRRNAALRKVTSVTPSRAVPYRAVPSSASNDSVQQAAPPALDEQVFDFWRERLHPEARVFDDDTRKKVRARLAEGFTVENLKQAIDGCKANPHNQGQNDRHKRFDQLELICRSGAHVNRFMADAGRPVSPAAGHQRAEDFIGQHQPPGTVRRPVPGMFGPPIVDDGKPQPHMGETDTGPPKRVISP
jgi:hypothetical protein